MKTNKILVGGLAGGVTFFFLGWLVYGILLNGYMTANLNQCAAKPMQEMVMWAMLLANIALGLLLAVVFSWSRITGILQSAKVAAIIGLLISVSIDLGNYSMTTLYKGFSIMLIDMLVYIIMMTLTGIVVCIVIGKKGAL